MNRYLLLVVALPLSVANVSVNVIFWSSHVEGVFADVIASLWAVGLTLVEFLFPAWAIVYHHHYRVLSILFYVVGINAAVFSILVFAMTIDNELSHHLESLQNYEQEKIQQEENKKLQKELAHIQLQAAQTAIDAAKKYNEVDKISLGTMPVIKQAEELAEKMYQTLQEEREAQKNTAQPHPLKYLLTLEALTGISTTTLKILLALILGTLVEAATILSIAALAKPRNEEHDRLKALPCHASVIQPTEGHHTYCDSDPRQESTDNQSSSTPHANDVFDNTVDETINTPSDNQENELTLLARVRRDILMGKFGDVPKLSELPKEYPGTGLRYPHVQQLRNQMINDGEAIPHGKARMKLKRIGDSDE